MLRVRNNDRVSMVKYATAQPPISLIDTSWSCLQNNNNNAYYVEVGAGSVNNNNKSNAYTTRAYQNGARYNISLESLIEAYYNCRKNKKSKNDCIRFEFERERSLIELQQSIADGCYKPRKSKCFIVAYPTYREVFAANFADRIIHHWIALRIEHLMERYFIDDSYNCRKGKGTTYGVNRAKEMFASVTDDYKQEAYIMKYDFAGYFMSIRKDILWQMVDEMINADYKGVNVDVLKYLVRCTIYNQPQNNCYRASPPRMWRLLPIGKSLFDNDANIGLPIGNLTSQLFANFYQYKIDKKMADMHKYYARYVDDGWVMDTDKKKMLRTIRWLRKEEEKMGVRLHRKKFYFQPCRHGMKAIGVVFRPRRTYITNRTIKRARKRIRELNKEMPTDETMLQYQASMNSYLGFMRGHCTYKIRKMLCEEISDAWKDYFVIDSDYNKINIDKMKTIVREPVSDLVILRHRAGKYWMYYGHTAIEGGYAAYVRKYAARPSLELANKHAAEIDSRYQFTEEEWSANIGHVNA